MSKKNKRSKVSKTNAMRFLDNLGISYVTHQYEFDPDNVGAESVIAETGLDPNNVFKTLVLRTSDDSYLVCVIPGLSTLDLKKVAQVTGHKSVHMIHVKELEPLTGYKRGGCSPFGLKHPFPIVLSSQGKSVDSLIVSGGKRGVQIELSVSDFLKSANLEEVNDITQ